MLLYVESAALAAGSAVLAGPASALLARARWTSRAPRAGLVLWQAIGLGCGLGILSAGLTLAAGSLESRWLDGIVAVPRRWHELGVLGWLGVAVTVSVGLWLVAATATSTARVVSARSAHRQKLDLVSARLAIEPGSRRGSGVDVRLVEHPHAVAYCLPGLRARVVLTRGVLDALAPAELDAVLAHERAHARGRHDLVVQPFVAWARTFPFLPTARSAVAAVELLVEMLADDVALRQSHPADLRGALGRLAGQQLLVTGTDAALHRHLDARAARIAPGAPAGLRRSATVAVYTLAVALVLVPPLVLLAS